jgi:hypothetical protein
MPVFRLYKETKTMKLTIFGVFAVTFCSLSFSGSALRAATISVVNPSFELSGPGTPLTDSIYIYNANAQPYGWAIANPDLGDDLEFVKNGSVSGWGAEDGSYAVDLNGVDPGNTIMTQTITGLDVGI